MDGREMASGQKADVQKLLEQGHGVELSPQGYSMHPFLTPGRDRVILETPSGPLRRGQVALYRRDSGLLVLHRVVKINRQGIYFVGDNQWEVEGPLRPEQVIGVMRGFVRKGIAYGEENLLYRAYSRLWLALRPLRPIFFSLARLRRRFLGDGRAGER